MSVFTIVRDVGGDWLGLYGKDGRLIREGHSFAESELLEMVGVAHDVISDVDIGEGGRLPASLGDVCALGAKSWRGVRP